MRILALLSTGVICALISVPAYADDEVEQFRIGFAKGCQDSTEQKAVSAGHEVKDEHRAKIAKVCGCIADGIASEVPSSEWVLLPNAPESNPTVARIAKKCVAQMTGN